MTNEELINYAKRGRTEAFCELYGKYKDRLYRYAYYKLQNHDDAEDAVADCVLSAYAQITQLKKPAAFDAWIFSILRACCNRQIRNQIRLRNEQPLEAVPQTAAYDFSAEVEKTELQEALSRLLEDEREIVLLSVVAGLNSKEIAGITDYTAGAVRSKLSRSLAKLRKSLEG